MVYSCSPNMSKRVAVVALGGNAIEDPSGGGKPDAARIMFTAQIVGFLLGEGYSVVVTHGNGPQVGELQAALLKVGSPLASRLDLLVAMTQGEIGQLLAESIRSVTRAECVVVLTSVVVSKDDPAFSKPTKPIGRYLDEVESAALARQGLSVRELHVDGHRVYRQVVPSPSPIDVVELQAIRVLLEQGSVVIACGGGGIPVIRVNGGFTGVNAVIDKDLASGLLAEKLGATFFIILTSVDAVMMDYGRPSQRPIPRLSVSQAERLLSEGAFEEGSMAPKVLACAKYTRATKNDSLITSPERLRDALKGFAGTRIVEA
jgi:carbamate kinase